MTKPVGQERNSDPVHPASAAGEDVFALAQWLKQMPAMPLHPLMTHPMAAVAAVTAIGFGMTGQIAGMVFGAMQGAAERTAMPVGRISGEDAGGRMNAPRTEQVTATQKVVRAKPRSARIEMKKAPAAAAASAATAEAVDDLKLISGVGPKLEQVLNGMGIRRYADIAAWSELDVAKIEGELGIEGRIARDGWVEQARVLGQGSR
ncbi:hypothetical protein [Sinorhizobium sp. BG8]|uniref:hypothetical protein n=1 Tax=Sinorhizobium sp. BG8 TaxID=2613773 RepID=UPI00193D1D6B|nr:hypothetical protein [Sinorhizobium sp. BG8]QRM55013.1 hypothetical protein F3Y30_11025 [Sinorhizobium sp. BG8]